MRVQSFYNSFNNLQRNKGRMTAALKEIQQGGISYEGFEGLHNAISHRNMVQEVCFADQFKASIDTAKHNHSLYDENLEDIQDNIQKINDLMIQRENDGVSDNGKEIINVQINSIIKTIQNLEKNKLNSHEDLYSKNDSEVIIGKNIRANRTFSDDLIKINNLKISEFLTSSTQEPDGELGIKNIQTAMDKISLSLAEVGSSHNFLESQEKAVQNVALLEQGKFENLKDIEASIIRFNEAKNGYEAQMLLISKIQDLSLVKYL